MEDFKGFFSKFKGAIIGVVIAIILLILELDKFIMGVVIILIGMFVGNYVQRNKTHVKEVLKKLIDRM